MYKNFGFADALETSRLLPRARIHEAASRATGLDLTALDPCGEATKETGQWAELCDLDPARLLAPAQEVACVDLLNATALLDSTYLLVCADHGW